VDADDTPKVTVENSFIVVVAQLHDLILNSEGPSASFQRFPRGVKQSLQLAVELDGPEQAAVHRREHLYGVDDLVRRQLQRPRDALANQLLDRVQNFFVAFPLDELKLSQLAGVGELHS